MHHQFIALPPRHIEMRVIPFGVARRCAQPTVMPNRPYLTSWTRQQEVTLLACQNQTGRVKSNTHPG